MTPKLDSTLSSPMIYSSSMSAASAPNTPRTLLPTTVMAGSSIAPQPSSTAVAAAPSNGNGNGGYNTAAQQQQQQQPIQVRKTSHKAAEQKRRDSLKTTFDDLRKLLPPILLPNDSSSPSLGPSTPHPSSSSSHVNNSNNSNNSNPTSSPHSPIFLATTPLLPGSLPPRGPPKAGGEGPNKGVSKLQLLICGNEFIRVLKARVERRDEEIERLRREVGRLRGLVSGAGAVGAGAEEAEGVGIGRSIDMTSSRTMSRIDEDGEGEEGEGGGNEEGDELDLERDLDAIELVPSTSGGPRGVHLKSGGSAGGGGGDQMDEGDDEDD